MDNKWRITDFLPGSELLRGTVGRPFTDSSLPAGGTLSAEAIKLVAYDLPMTYTPHGRECVYLVLEGTLAISQRNGLGGTVGRGTYVHVREDVAHTISTTEGCRVLRFDCGFAMWDGIALPGSPQE